MRQDADSPSILEKPMTERPSSAKRFLPWILGAAILFALVWAGVAVYAWYFGFAEGLHPNELLRQELPEGANPKTIHWMYDNRHIVYIDHGAPEIAMSHDQIIKPKLKKIEIVDTENWKKELLFETYAIKTNISPKGDMFVVWDNVEKFLSIWDLKTRKEIRRFSKDAPPAPSKQFGLDPFFGSDEDWPQHICLSEKNEYLAIVGRRNTISIFDLDLNCEIFRDVIKLKSDENTLEYYGLFFDNFAFSKNDKYLFATNQEGLYAIEIGGVHKSFLKMDRPGNEVCNIIQINENEVLINLALPDKRDVRMFSHNLE
jgi:WD40 repeat protein